MQRAVTVLRPTLVPTIREQERGIVSAYSHGHKCLRAHIRTNDAGPSRGNSARALAAFNFGLVSRYHVPLQSFIRKLFQNPFVCIIEVAISSCEEVAYEREYHTMEDTLSKITRRMLSRLLKDVCMTHHPKLATVSTQSKENH